MHVVGAHAPSLSEARPGHRGGCESSAIAVERAQKIIGAALSFAGVQFQQHDSRLRYELRPDCARGITWSMQCKRARVNGLAQPERPQKIRSSTRLAGLVPACPGRTAIPCGPPVSPCHRSLLRQPRFHQLTGPALFHQTQSGVVHEPPTASRNGLPLRWTWRASPRIEKRRRGRLSSRL